MTRQGLGPTRGRARLLRGATLGGLSLVLASGAHVAGGGLLPGPGVLAVAAVLLGLVAALVTARRCRFGVLALLLVGQQALLHALFSVAAAAPTHLAVHHHPAAADLGPAALHVSGAPAMDMASPGWPMLLAHALATLATAWLLARGEAWLWRAADAVVAAAGLRRAPRVRRATPRTSPSPYLVPRHEARAWRPAGPRGPPVVVAG